MRRKGWPVSLCDVFSNGCIMSCVNRLLFGSEDDCFFALSHFKSWWNKSLHCIMRGLIILALLFVSWHCLWRGTSAPNTSRCRLWWLKLVWDGRVLGLCLHDDKKHIWLLQHLTGTFSLFSPKSQTGGGIFELSECLLKSPENCFPNAFGPLFIQLAAAFLTLVWWKEK